MAEVKNVKVVRYADAHNFKLVFASEAERDSDDTKEVLTYFRNSVAE